MFGMAGITELRKQSCVDKNCLLKIIVYLINKMKTVCKDLL